MWALRYSSPPRSEAAGPIWHKFHRYRGSVRLYATEGHAKVGRNDALLSMRGGTSFLEKDRDVPVDLLIVEVELVEKNNG